MRVVAVLLFTCVSALGSSGYTREMFRRAMSKDNVAVSGSVSLSPLYVLITVRDPKTHEHREVCTLATYLQRAITSEYHLDILRDGRKVFDIAMSAPNRILEFKSRKARENVAPDYSLEQLASVRRLLHGRSRTWLLREAEVDLMKEPNAQGFVTRIYRRDIGRKFWSSYPLRVAVAHVLLEHGILVGEAHYGGMLGVLYIDRKT